MLVVFWCWATCCGARCYPYSCVAYLLNKPPPPSHVYNYIVDDCRWLMTLSMIVARNFLFGGPICSIDITNIIHKSIEYLIYKYK